LVSGHRVRVDRRACFEGEIEPPAAYGLEGLTTLESDLIQPVIYPSEWSFSMLKDAALLTLDVTLATLEAGMELKDASSFNVVFDGVSPRFVDIGSFSASFSGFWRGYSQFVDHFLAPLFLEAYRGVPFQRYLRGNLGGIPVLELGRMLRFRDTFRPGVMRHVRLRAAVEKRTARYDADRRSDTRSSTKLPVEVVVATVNKMRKLVAKLQPSGAGSEWANYMEDVPYSAQEHDKKRQAFASMAASSKGGRLAWDVGANDGTFSEILATHFDRVVALDGDAGAVERMYSRLRQSETANVIPAVVDFADPPEGRGWTNTERLAFSDRAKPDLAAWLAVVHHLAISAQIPLERIANTIAESAPHSIIEWIDEDDPQVRLLLAGYEEGDRPYSIDVFRTALEGRGEVVEEAAVSETRSLWLFQRR